MATKSLFEIGEKVQAICFGGIRKECVIVGKSLTYGDVWFISNEDEYQAMVKCGKEPVAVGFHERDLVKGAALSDESAPIVQFPPKAQ